MVFYPFSLGSILRYPVLWRYWLKSIPKNSGSYFIGRCKYFFGCGIGEICSKTRTRATNQLVEKTCIDRVYASCLWSHALHGVFTRLCGCFCWRDVRRQTGQVVAQKNTRQLCVRGNHCGWLLFALSIWTECAIGFFLMVNGEWWMVNGEWWMVNGEWWMMNGEWWMVIWWMVNGEWWMVNGEWWMMNDEWWMMNDEWWMMNGEWWIFQSYAWEWCETVLCDTLERSCCRTRLDQFPSAGGVDRMRTGWFLLNFWQSIILSTPAILHGQISQLSSCIFKTTPP